MNAAQEAVWEQDYQPFGEDWSLPATDYSTESEYKFTGQNKVREVGLYYYGARYCDPEIGRFVTEDTYDGTVSVQLSQNRYVYVLENPIKYTDSTGHREWDLGSGFGQIMREEV